MRDGAVGGGRVMVFGGLWFPKGFFLGLGLFDILGGDSHVFLEGL